MTRLLTMLFIGFLLVPGLATSLIGCGQTPSPKIAVKGDSKQDDGDQKPTTQNPVLLQSMVALNEVRFVYSALSQGANLFPAEPPKCVTVGRDSAGRPTSWVWKSCGLDGRVSGLMNFGFDGTGKLAGIHGDFMNKASTENPAFWESIAIDRFACEGTQVCEFVDGKIKRAGRISLGLQYGAALTSETKAQIVVDSGDVGLKMDVRDTRLAMVGFARLTVTNAYKKTKMILSTAENLSFDTKCALPIPTGKIVYLTGTGETGEVLARPDGLYDSVKKETLAWGDCTTVSQGFFFDNLKR